MVVNDTLLENFKESVQPGGLKLCENSCWHIAKKLRTSL
jgi:hypothetical protein